MDQIYINRLVNDQQMGSTFDYSSAFRYNSPSELERSPLLDSVITHQSSTKLSQQQQGSIQQILYGALVSLSFLFLLVTFPFSVWFYIKKVDSLKRCLVYRLGRRLPMKGPGLVCQLPFIDQITMVDLAESRFAIVSEEKQILTADGSIVLVKPLEASLSVVNSVLTTLKADDVDVKQLIRVRFDNMIHSTHVEDLENKLDFAIRSFEENCNRILKDWGHSIKISELPRITVIKRADPVNPIKTKLEQFFNQSSDDKENLPESSQNGFEGMLSHLFGGGANQTNTGKFTKLEHLDNSTAASSSSTADSVENHDDILLNLLPANVSGKPSSSQPSKPIMLSQADLKNITPVLQKMVDENGRMMPFFRLNLKLLIENEDNLSDPRYEHYFQYHNGKIKPLNGVPKTVRLLVHFSHYHNFNQFINTSDLKYLKFEPIR